MIQYILLIFKLIFCLAYKFMKGRKIANNMFTITPISHLGNGSFGNVYKAIYANNKC